MSNQLIIDNFRKLIKLIEYETNNLTDKKQIMMNSFRIASLKKALGSIIKFTEKITTSKQIANLKGVGKGTINRVDEIINTGTLAELVDYEKIITKYSNNEKIIDDLMKVIGIGRIMAQHLINTYKIKSATELKKLSDSGKIILNDKLKLGLKYLGKFQGSIPRSEIDKTYDYLQNLTDNYKSSMFITICGSYRRGLPISSDIDILLCDINIMTAEDLIVEPDILQSYVKYLHEKKYLLDDITDKNIKTKYMGFGQLTSKSPIRRVDIRLIPMISYFPALLYFTGSYEFNQEMRSQAKKLGFKLNEYGLYDNRTDEMIVVLSELEMFSKLGMNYISPDQR
jgi:DNA polymerase/3'-5' exonuclease PolX